jgi:hypothetical protein
MTEHPSLKPGEKVVALSSLSRSVGVASALAAAISYKIVYVAPDLFTTILLLGTALLIGVTVGFLGSMRFRGRGRDNTTTIVKHGKAGVPMTLGTAVTVGALVTLIFMVFAKVVFEFDGNFIGLAATTALPATLVASIWALMASLA